MARTGIIILAAGASSRFGAPKQLAVLDGQTLIQRAVNTACQSGCNPIVVVLGANAEKIARHIAGPVRIHINTEWASGMGSSIRCGLSALPEGLDAVIIMLADQPFITPDLLRSLETTARHGIAAAEFDGEIGVPACFPAEFFPALRALDGPGGAKQILHQNKHRVIRLPCPEASLDIDTPEDLRRLKKC